MKRQYCVCAQASDRHAHTRQRLDKAAGDWYMKVRAEEKGGDFRAALLAVRAEMLGGEDVDDGDLPRKYADLVCRMRREYAPAPRRSSSHF